MSSIEEGRGKDRPYEPRSEDMFLAWFLRLPHSANVAEEARLEIGRLDRAPPGDGVAAGLRALLLQASAVPPVMTRGRRRSRH